MPQLVALNTSVPPETCDIAHCPNDVLIDVPLSAAHGIGLCAVHLLHLYRDLTQVFPLIYDEAELGLRLIEPHSHRCPRCPGRYACFCQVGSQLKDKVCARCRQKAA